MTVDFRDQLNQLEKEILIFEEQMAQLTKDVKEISDDIGSLTESASEFEQKEQDNSENEEFKLEFHDLEGTIANLKQKKDDCNIELEGINEKIHNLKAKKENILNNKSVNESNNGVSSSKPARADIVELDYDNNHGADVAEISETDVVVDEESSADRKDSETGLNLMLSKDGSKNDNGRKELDTQPIDLKAMKDEIENSVDPKKSKKVTTAKMRNQIRNTDKIRTSKIMVNKLSDEDKVELDADLLYSQGKITEILDLHFSKISEQSVELAKVTIEKILKFTNTQVGSLNKTVNKIENQLKEIAGRMIGFQKHMNNLTTAFNQKFIGDKTKDEAFNKLYESMKDYKDNFLFKAQKPVFIDLIILYDDIQKMIAQQTNEKSQLTLLSDMIKEILYRNDITMMSFDDKNFDSTYQKAIRRIDTDKPEDDRTIVEVLKQGFISCEMIIRPQEVVVYKYVKPEEKKES